MCSGGFLTLYRCLRLGNSPFFAPLDMFDPFFCFGFFDIEPGFDPFVLIRGSLETRPDSIPSFCFKFFCIALGFDPFILFQVLLHRTWIRSLHFVSSSPTSRPESIPSICFGFSSIAPRFDPFVLFPVLRHHALIRSLRFVSSSPASCPDSISSFCFKFSGIVPEFDPFFFMSSSPASCLDLIFFFFFFFEFSSIVPGFYPFFFLRVLRHRAQISLSFPASCSYFPHLSRYHDRASLIFSDIASDFLLSFLASCLDHSSSQASCSGFS